MGGGRRGALEAIQVVTYTHAMRIQGSSGVEFTTGVDAVEEISNKWWRIRWCQLAPHRNSPKEGGDL